MNQERWQAIERLYHAALVRPVGERAGFLAAACGGDAALRREVEALLAAPATGDGIFAAPALAMAGVGRALSDPPTLPGLRLGVYQLQARIGAGGMGEVYRARDTRLGRDVAIKIFYVAPDGGLMAAAIAARGGGEAPLVRSVERLFTTRMAGGPLPGPQTNQYAVSDDGRRFLLNTLLEESVSPITVVLNWRP